MYEFSSMQPATMSTGKTAKESKKKRLERDAKSNTNRRTGPALIKRDERGNRWYSCRPSEFVPLGKIQQSDNCKRLWGTCVSRRVVFTGEQHREKPPWAYVCSRPATDRRLRQCTPLHRPSSDRCTACHSARSGVSYTAKSIFLWTVDRVGRRALARSRLFSSTFYCHATPVHWMAPLLPDGERG